MAATARQEQSPNLEGIDPRSFDAARRSQVEDGQTPVAYLAELNGALALRLVGAAVDAKSMSPSDAYLSGAADVMRIVLARLEAQTLEQPVAPVPA